MRRRESAPWNGHLSCRDDAHDSGALHAPRCNLAADGAGRDPGEIVPDFLNDPPKEDSFAASTATLFALRETFPCNPDGPQ